jgi:hypothetical protein
MHHSFQVTIMAHITYKINPIYIKDNAQNKVIKESHFYVNDKKEHDISFVQHYMLFHWQWLFLSKGTTS